MDGDQMASLIKGVHALRFVANFAVASCALFIWDYILTFRMEVDLVWKSQWTFMKGLYLLQRYLPFIDTAWLTLYVQLKTGLTNTACQKIYPPSSALITVGFTASDMILTLRTWAVWNRNPRLSIILPTLYVFLWFPSYVIDGLYVNSMKFGDPPFPRFPGCVLTHSMDIRSLTFSWALMTFWDALMLGLMLVPTLREYRSGGTLMKVVYRDGVTYYLYLFVLSLTNALVVKTLPSESQQQYRGLLTPMSRVLHSTFASRVLLHIRAQKDPNLTNTISISIS